ncbi:MAG: murein L,D-transpeptidase catalytic domain-containing protein [Chitinophagaceae bacterium]
MRLTFLLAFLLISFLGVYLNTNNIGLGKNFGPLMRSPDKSEDISIRLKDFGDAANKYVGKHDFNRKYCFLIDMRISSANKRFFIYDFSKKQSIDAGLVAHGSGLNDTAEIAFSNIPGSNCSSLGKYRIGQAYQGKFGLAYKLHGLEETNENAFERFVVLHAHSCVPEEEVNASICESWGCPTVAPAYLEKLQGLIDRSRKPVLLWIYN